MPDQVNQQIKSAEDSFKTIAWDLLVKATLEYFHLDFWPMNLIFTFFTDKLYEQTRMSFDLAAITFLNAEHKAAFDKASVVLKIVAHDYGIESPEFLRARENAKDQLSRFVRYNAI